MAGNAASGRRPVPTALKVLRGNPGQRRIRPEPIPRELESLAPPDDLNREERKVWRRHAANLKQMGVLTANDVEALKGYCRVVAHVPHTKPGSLEWDRTLKALLQFARDFGMTPASRVKLAAPDRPTDDESLIR